MMWKGLARFEVVEQSMAPALLSGDYLVTSNRPACHGDIIAFSHRDKVLIKRLIGLPHDLVNLGVDGTWQLRDDEYFVVSDNRDRPTVDSRRFGPIKAEQIIGPLMFRYWPLSRIGRVASSVPN